MAPASSSKATAFADARTSIGGLITLLAAEPGSSKVGWALALGLAAAANVLVMHSVNIALRVRSDSGAPVGELLMFGLGVALNLGLLAYVSQRVLDALTAAVSRTTERILDALGRLDLEQFEEVGREEILSRVNGDAGRIVPYSGVLIQLLIAAPTLVLSVLYVATISVEAALVSLAVMVAIAVFISGLNQKALGQIRSDQAARRRMQEPIADLLAGFKQLKQHQPRSAAVAEAFEAEAAALKNSRDAYYRQFFARDTLSRQSYFVLLGVVSFILPLVVPAIASEASQLLVTTSFIFRPVTTVVMAIPMLTQIGAAWQRLCALEERLYAMAPSDETPVEPATPFRRLSLRAVRYEYPSQAAGSGFAVGPCDLELSPGEVVFVTGANGSGKSTFVKLLCGLYRRHGGEILVDGEPVPLDPGAAWRSRFATVFAEFALFERAYGLEQVAPERVAALLAEMELSHKVRFEQGRFDTVDLSTGQRKRLALIIALLQDRPIYVFDEWAADQDPHFREAFYRRILPELKARGKAVVAVTHDDDAFDACDRRLHFERGRAEPA